MVECETDRDQVENRLSFRVKIVEEDQGQSQ